MAVRVPFHLRRRPEPVPAVALLLNGDDPAALLAACARLAHPLVFNVAGGFLLVADAIPEAVPNALRMRRLSENLYLPADADLVPSLRPAEAVELTAGRGLVFLPNRQPLAFDPAHPLRPAAFLAVPKPRRDDWEPFPTGHPPADRLTALVREVTVPPDELLAGGGPPLGTDDARPPQVGIGRSILGRLSAGLGRGLGAVGRAVGSGKLGNLGSKLKGLGAALAPRISEELLGRQEAALQGLLQKFRGGETDDALRQSIPVGGDPGRGGGVYNSDRLPTNNMNWSFGGLFGQRTGSVWAGGNPDTWRELIAEYRRAAQQAADRGDFRRAALIYAKLLNDFRAAAEVLSRGGLHREAGILFRDKVRHLDRAAREFEKAGEHDEALRLYREANLLVEAGDLLRRMGEEDAAVAEYHRAADRAIELRQDFVEAGDLILKKTGRADLAARYFADGWEVRTLALTGARNAAACAERLIEVYAADPDERFWRLLDEAEEWLGEPGRSADAGRFFNRVALLADLPHLRPTRGELRDRARLGLAGKLRQHGRAESTPGTAVAELFGSSGHWSPAVVSDADYALRVAMRARPKDERPARRPFSVTRLYDGVATAAVQASNRGVVFVGFKDGVFVNYDPESWDIRAGSEPDPRWQVIGLATDPDAEEVVALRAEVQGADAPLGECSLAYYQWADGGYRQPRIAAISPPNLTVYGLLPEIDRAPRRPTARLSTAEGVQWYQLPDLVLVPDLGLTPALPPTTHLQVLIPDTGFGTSFTFQGGSVTWETNRAFVGWMPESARGSTLYAPPLAWLVASPVHVELAGLYDKATLYWTEVERRPDRLGVRTIPFVSPAGFRGAAIWRVGHVVGVTGENRVLWLRARGNRFEEWAPPTDLNVPARAVGCFSSRRTNEVLVVLDDGSLARVPVPR